jgi:hypothetical protein
MGQVYSGTAAAGPQEVSWMAMSGVSHELLDR